MIQVKIGNSVCAVSGLTPKQFEQVRDLMSYKETTRDRWRGFGSVKRHLMDRRGEFPTGLLYLLTNYLLQHKLESQLNDTRKRPGQCQGMFNLQLGYEPYPEQIDAAKACVVHERGIICAPTGVGKSAIAALIIHALQLRTLVVVPSLELKRQLTEGLAKAFGERQVGNLKQGRDIAIENVDALDTKKALKGYDCVIIDEFHHSGAATYRKLNKKAWSGVFYKFGLTATPFRSKDEERLLLESVLSRTIFKIDYQTAVAKGYIVPMEAYYIELPKVRVKARTYPAVYSELVVRREDRNELIVDLILSLQEAGRSTLVLVKQISHGEVLQQLAENDGLKINFANGEDDFCREMIQLFNLTKTTALLGTEGVIGEGVDTKPCEYVVLAGGGKSKNAFMQKVGRGFRKYPGKESCKIILIKDESHKWLKEHFKACVKYLREEYGIVPAKLDL